LCFRVLNPPGGRSNNIFGFAEEEKPAVNVKQQVTEPAGVTTIGGAPQQQTQSAHRMKSTLFDDPSQNPSKPRTGYNPITGKTYEEEESVRRQAEQDKKAEVAQTETITSNTSPNDLNGKSRDVHTSSRVLQPPGGKTTRLW
jgi:hypothetical protein